MIKGSCACGRIQYESSTQTHEVTACHCGTCQRISGGPFLGFAHFPVKNLKWSQNPDIWSASDIAERGFCKVCGSAMSMQYAFDLNNIGITLGTITVAQPPVPKLGAHIFLAEKASWFVLPDDGASRQDAFGPSFQDRITEWRLRQQRTASST